MMINMNELTIINLEWSNYNGFVFKVLLIDAWKIDGALFGINCARKFFYVDILFFTIKIYSRL